MKVLWITSVYPSDVQPGAGVFHETQVQELVKLGAEVTVICPVPRNYTLLQMLKTQYRAGREIPEVYVRKGVTVHRPRYLALPGQLRWAQPDKRIAEAVLQTMEKYEIHPELIHAHFAMPSGGATRIIAEHFNLPWILTLHGSDVNVYPDYSSSARKAFIQAVRSATQVIAVSRSLIDKAKQLTGRNSMLLPIGIDLNRYQINDVSKEKLRRALHLPNDKKIIVFVGRLTEAKGVFELEEALNHLSEEFAVVFVGDGPAREKLSKNPNLNSRLFLSGQVENERVKDFLMASDLFTLPSYTEGMPTVVIEAIALKLPVICTSVGGIPEFFGQYRNLLIEPKSVKSLVERIREVMDEGSYSNEILDELFTHVQVNYHAQHNAVKLVDVYEEAISNFNLGFNQQTKVQ